MSEQLHFDWSDPPIPGTDMNLTNPIAHADDPETSHEAAETVCASGTRDRHARRVLELVRTSPDSTAIELMESQTGALRLTEYQIRRRLTDLKESGRVAQCAARPCRVRGTRMVTWRATTNPQN